MSPEWISASTSKAPKAIDINPLPGISEAYSDLPILTGLTAAIPLPLEGYPEGSVPEAGAPVAPDLDEGQAPKCCLRRPSPSWREGKRPTGRTFSTSCVAGGALSKGSFEGFPAYPVDILKEDLFVKGGD